MSTWRFTLPSGRNSRFRAGITVYLHTALFILHLFLTFKLVQLFTVSKKELFILVHFNLQNDDMENDPIQRFAWFVFVLDETHCKVSGCIPQQGSTKQKTFLEETEKVFKL